MKKIKAVIIDDEVHAIETLQWKIDNYVPEVEVVATFDDPMEGLNYLKKNAPDILFLDIQMPMLSGFDVLEELGPRISYNVVFTTAFDQFGIQALKASALDYLLKPVQNRELKYAIEKHLKKEASKHRSLKLEGLINNVNAEKKGAVKKIALATKETIEFVKPEEIVLCTSDSNYTMVFMEDGRKKLISKTLKEFEDLLTPYGFYRTHNSHLVNLSKIKELVRGDGGYLVMKNQMKVPVSKSKKEMLLKKLQ